MELTLVPTGRNIVETERLVLVASTLELARAELAGAAALAGGLSAYLGARVDVPGDWPPPLNDEESMRHFLDILADDDWETVGWSMWYFLLKQGEGLAAVGNGGYKGAPDDEGTAELGYSVMPEYQRRGIAPEAVRALIDWGVKYGALKCVIAHTLVDLTPSIRVLEKCGFAGPLPTGEDGVIRFERALGD